MPFFLSPSSWTFPLRQGSSSSLLILPGLLRSDRGGLSVSSPSGEREGACGLRRWRKFPALEFYSACFLPWISSLSYPYFTTLYILNKRLIKQLFPDFRRRRPRFEFPGSTGAGPRHTSTTWEALGVMNDDFKGSLMITLLSTQPTHLMLTVLGCIEIKAHIHNSFNTETF